MSESESMRAREKVGESKRVNLTIKVGVGWLLRGYTDDMSPSRCNLLVTQAQLKQNYLMNMGGGNFLQKQDAITATNYLHTSSGHTKCIYIVYGDSCTKCNLLATQAQLKQLAAECN